MITISQVVAGQSPLCNKRGKDSGAAAFPVIDAAFSPEGTTLYVAEQRPGKVGAVLRAIDQNGAAREVAGFQGSAIHP